MRQPSPDMVAGSRHLTSKAGWLTVVTYHRADDISVKFDQTDTVVSGVNAANIRRGNVSDPMFPTVHGYGYHGVGSYSFAGHRSAYGRWAGMIGRVHAPQTKQIRKNYHNCSIVPEWYNFQNFARWFYDQPLNFEDGHELDKDLRVEGNRIYGPETCLLIPRELNSLVSNDGRANKFGSGVGKASGSNRYYAHIKSGGQVKHLGSFDTADEATQVYAKAKKDEILKTAIRLEKVGLLTSSQLILVRRRFEQ